MTMENKGRSNRLQYQRTREQARTNVRGRKHETGGTRHRTSLPIPSTPVLPALRITGAAA